MLRSVQCVCGCVCPKEKDDSKYVDIIKKSVNQSEWNASESGLEKKRKKAK